MALFQVELRNDKDPNRSKFKSVESGSEEAALANTSLPGWTARKAVPVSKADESKHAKKKARRFPDAEMDNFLETCAGMLEAEMSSPGNFEDLRQRPPEQNGQRTDSQNCEPA